MVHCRNGCQMGFGIDIDSMVYGDLENDAELEAELRALQEEDGGDVQFGRRQGGFAAARGLYCCTKMHSLLMEH